MGSSSRLRMFAEWKLALENWVLECLNVVILNVARLTAEQKLRNGRKWMECSLLLVSMAHEYILIGANIGIANIRTFWCSKLAISPSIPCTLIQLRCLIIESLFSLYFFAIFSFSLHSAFHSCHHLFILPIFSSPSKYRSIPSRYLTIALSIYTSQAFHLSFFSVDFKWVRMFKHFAR